MEPSLSHRIRRVVLLGATSLLAGLLLAQCRSVTDTVFGRGANALKAQSCLSKCQDTANSQLNLENKLHTTNVKACNDNAACLAQEEARHEAAVAAIQAARKSCQSGCHHQGGGSGR